MSLPRAGTTVLDRYVLGIRIGIGGMSEVYQAIDTIEHRTAAAKLLSPAFAHDPRAWDLARREAWVMRQVRHPSVPHLYEAGEATLDGEVVPCIVMELIPGTMLTDRLRQGALPWQEAIGIVATIADAMAVAHRRGIVHRDLTSENLMMTPSGIKIIDFGLAGRIEDEDQQQSRSRRGMAVADDPPPSNMRVGDPADDVYSIGVLLYQMLTGRSPYPSVGDMTHPAAARLRSVAPTPVLNIPGLPRQIADICRDCMAKRPADRPESGTVALTLWSVLVPEGTAQPAALRSNTTRIGRHHLQSPDGSPSPN